MKHFYLKFAKTTLIKSLLGIILLLGTQGLQAQITSTSTGGNWADGTTWVGGIAPNATDNVVIATTGTDKVTIAAAVTQTAGTVTVNSGATLAINFATTFINLTVTGTCTNTVTPTISGTTIYNGTAAQSVMDNNYNTLNLIGGVKNMVLILVTTRTITNLSIDSASEFVVSETVGAPRRQLTISNNFSNAGKITATNTGNNLAADRSAINLAYTLGNVKTNSGIINADSMTFNTSVVFTNSGTIKLVKNYGGSGAFTNNSGAVLEMNGSVTAGFITNSGTLTVGGTLALLMNTITNASTGIVNLNGAGTMTISSINNGTSSVLTGGTINIASSLGTISFFNNYGGAVNISASPVPAITNFYAKQLASLPSTVNYNGLGAQTINLATVGGGYENLILSGSGAKTIATASAANIASGTLSITSATASVTNTGVLVGKLTLGVNGKNSGTWGSIASAATNKTDTYFTAGVTGTILVNTNTRLATTITATGATTFVYNGSPQGPASATVVGSTNTPFYSYSGTGATVYGPIATQPINAGTYQVIASVAGDENYNFAASVPLAFDITTATWTGTTSTDFNVGSNWLNSAVPAINDFIDIPTGLSNYPVISANTTVAGAAIAAGASLTVNEGFTLTNTGTITNNGDLILKSSALGTANLLSPTAVANVTQQRYLSSNQRGWRLLSNPLSTKTFNTLATASTFTLGTNYTGDYQSATNTWTSTDGTANMTTQQAYKVFITGLTGESPSYATGPSNVTIVNKGTAANTVPAAINTTLGEYYLVANPYTAPVSVSSIIGASTGLSNSVSYYNPTIGSTDVRLKFGGYDFPTVSGAAGSATDVVIPPMGAIFVQATSAGTINVPKTAIFTGTPLQAGTYNHKTAQTKVAVANELKVEVSSDATYYDTVTLRFKTAGDANSNIDFGKLPNTILDAYSLVESEKMAVAELELKEQTIPLGITTTIQKNYTFKVAENTIPAGYEAVLVDNVLNTSTPLTPGTHYNFAIDSTPASQGDSRFAINLKTSGSLGVKANELDSKIQLWPNPAHSEFNIRNAQNAKDGASTIEISTVNGQVIHSQKSNPGTTTTIQTNGWANGVYILKAINNGTQTTKKLILQ
ncbi:MAG: T9SS type A sorting domain-containing protein [Flavobacterium sp.]|nr:T9SS type A sorting domain-containing protein [Flavobacterium sp.]